jgi:hypothetical protein
MTDSRPGPPVPEAPAKRSFKNPIRAVVGLATIAPIVVLVSGGVPWCMGFEAPALRRIEACPLAVEALGAPVSRAWLGLSCGNAETSGATGEADWTFPVAGPRGRGALDLVAVKQGGDWVLHRALLETDRGSIDVLTCTGGGPIGVQNATYRARVATILGEPAVAAGDACTVTVEAAPPGGTSNCRVRVDCGGRLLYGAGTTGYASCSRGQAGGLVGRDDMPTSSGGDPTLDLDVAAREVILTDQTSRGTWVVQLALDAAP